MYVAFHCGIFFDGRESSYCRPTFYEVVHQAPNFKGHLAHVGWPWVDECIAVLKIGARFLRIDPAEWGLKVDLRSEEHTSELQSRQYLVCRLLLEKKHKSQLHSHPLL